MTATTEKPGHQRQLVPGENSNPDSQEGEAVMSASLRYESKSAEIVANIAQAMKAQGLDETSLSEAADIEKTLLLNILSMREELNMDDFARIATALGVKAGGLLPPAATAPAWSGHSHVYRAEDEPVAAEHFGPVVGVPDGNGQVVMFVKVSQLAMKDGTIEPAMVGVEQDGERAFEFPLDLTRAFVEALQMLQDAVNGEVA